MTYFIFLVSIYYYNLKLTEREKYYFKNINKQISKLQVLFVSNCEIRLRHLENIKFLSIDLSQRSP